MRTVRVQATSCQESINIIVTTLVLWLLNSLAVTASSTGSSRWNVADSVAPGVTSQLSPQQTLTSDYSVVSSTISESTSPPPNVTSPVEPSTISHQDLSSTTQQFDITPSTTTQTFDNNTVTIRTTPLPGLPEAPSTLPATATPSIILTSTSTPPPPPSTTTTTTTTTSTITTTTSIEPQQPTLTSSNSQPNNAAAFSPQPYCTLGDDTFQIGERWNPNLPPFGVQVCVLCECTIRQRKSCYESKVTCRRITNECPVIESCPDGKKPVTVAGQCCKSCQSPPSSIVTPQQDGNMQVQQHQTQTIGNQSPAYESQQQQSTALLQTPFKIVYMNERIKEYLSMVKSLSPCESKPNPLSGPTTPPPHQSMVSKGPKGSRNDLNGIDTRLAFKSLNDYPSNQPHPSKSRHDAPTSQEETNIVTTTVSSRRVDQSEDHHQHPNDVQSASSSNNNNISNNNNNNNNNLHQHAQSTNYVRVRQYSSSNCILGNDTFQVGDVWNPILPPFGVQLCVQCNCIFRVRKGCYETKVTCRRISKDCPVIDVCPNGKAPETVSGQCCKSCPSSVGQVEQQPISFGSGTATTSSIMPIDGIQRNEKVYREFQSTSRNLPVCVRVRESVDIYNTNRYARRSHQA